MKKCTVGKIHKWEFSHNVKIMRPIKDELGFSIHKRGEYKCACGEIKIGPAQ